MTDSIASGHGASGGHAGTRFHRSGDLAKLSCDAWLVPSGSRPGPGTRWKHAVSPAVPDGTPVRWGQGVGRVIPWEPLHSGWPRPWVVRTFSQPDAPADTFIESARQFLITAAAALGAAA